MNNGLASALDQNLGRERYKPMKVLLGILAIFIVFIALFWKINSDGKLNTWQERYWPALTLTCDGKMGVPSYTKVSGSVERKKISSVQKFLSRKGTRSFSCTQWPKGTTVEPFEAESNHLRFFHRFQYYLLALVGYIWMVTGPSWAVVEGISAAMATGIAVGLYAVSRYFVGIIPAAALTTWLVYEKTNLGMMPRTRDYGKAFFIIVGFWLLYRLVCQNSKSLRSLLIGCLLLGVFFGVGYGFRQDMLAATIVSVALLIFCVRIPPKSVGPDIKRQIFYRTACSLAVLVGFSLAALPAIVAVPVDHGNEGHFLILGLSEDSLARAHWNTLTTWLSPIYSDFQGYASIIAYEMAVTGQESLRPFTQSYNELSRQLFVEYALVFPFDVLGRIAGALFRIAAGKVDWLIVPILISLFIIYRSSPRQFTFVVLYLCAMAAVVSLQFQDRQFFHVPMIAKVFTWAVLIGFIFTNLRRFEPLQSIPIDLLSGHTNSFSSNHKTDALIYRLAPIWISVFIVGAVSLTWVVQQYTQTKWQQTVISSNRTPLVGMKVQPGPKAPYTELIFNAVDSWPDFRGQTVTRDAAEKLFLTGGYLELTFGTRKACGLGNIPISTRYDAKNRSFALNSPYRVELNEQKKTSLILPIFIGKDSKFDKFLVPSRRKGCFISAQWIEGFDKIRIPAAFQYAH